MLLTPSEALNVKNGASPIDTATAANGAVVCGPRLSANDLRFSTLTLKPEPVLCIIYLSVHSCGDLERYLPPRPGRRIPTTVKID